CGADGVSWRQSHAGLQTRLSLISPRSGGVTLPGFCGRFPPQCPHCFGNSTSMALTSAEGANRRCWPGCPGWPPGFRLLLCFRPRVLGSPANPSEEGGLEELVEFFSRPASCRFRSAICFLASAIC